MLSYCNDCKEYSVKTKVYVRKSDGIKCRVEFCLNSGCGYSKDLPILKKPLISALKLTSLQTTNWR